MRIHLLLSCFAMAPGLLFAQPDSNAIRLSTDDPVVARLDDLAALPWIQRSTFTTDTAAHNVHGFSSAQVPVWSAGEVQHRLTVVDERTPFDLIYNQPLHGYIDLYTVRKRELCARMLGLAELYFPVFE